MKSSISLCPQVKLFVRSSLTKIVGYDKSWGFSDGLVGMYKFNYRGQFLNVSVARLYLASSAAVGLRLISCSTAFHCFESSTGMGLGNIYISPSSFNNFYNYYY